MTLLTQNQIVQLIKILNETNFSRLDLEFEGFKITACKAKSKINEFNNYKNDFNYNVSSSIKTSDVGQLKQSENIDDESENKLQTEINEDYLEQIKAPMLGTFYAAPNPESAPFVKLGDFVSKNDPVCIIEVMKLYNTVNAGIDGYIRKVLVEDGQMVEYNQPLFLIEPYTLEQ